MTKPEPTAEEKFELETINKLFLELSQFATAKTAREIELEKQNQSPLKAIAEEVEAIPTKNIEMPVAHKYPDYAELKDFIPRDLVLEIITKHIDK